MAVRNFLACLWRLALLFALAGSAQAQVRAASEPVAAPVVLSAASVHWIEAHRRVKVGTVENWAPIDMFGPDGRYEGVSGSVLERIGRALGLRFEVTRYADYRDALAAVERGEVQLLPSIARSSERERSLAFTRAYLSLKVVLIARRGTNDLGAGTGFADRRVAIEPGYALEEYLRREHPRAERVPMPDTASALRAVAEGRADAYIGLESTSLFVVEHERIPGLEIVDELPLDIGALHFATAAHDTALRDALDAALAAIGPEAIARIAADWEPRMLLLGRGIRPALADADRAAVRAIGEVRAAYDGSMAPISWADAGGQGSGYAIDMFDAVAKRLGLGYRYVPARAFSAALDALRAREVDVLIAAARTPERLEFAEFVGPYYSAPSVIVTRLDADWNSLAVLSGHTLAIDRSHYLIPSIRRETPGVRVVEYPSVRDAMLAVVHGEAQAMVTHIEVATRLIRTDFLGRLQVNGVVEGRPSELYFAVRSDRPELAALLKRGLDAIPEADRAAYVLRWLRTSYAAGVPWARIAAIGMPALALLLGVIGFVTLYNRRLRAEVLRRGAAEAALVAERDAARAQAAAKADFLATMGHEIRTPFAAISSGIELLQNRLHGSEHARLVDRMQRASRYLVKLLDDILDYAKLDAHRIALRLEPVRLERLAAEVLEEFEPVARAKGLALRFEAGGDAEGAVMADPLRLRQVLSNLIGNALKFTPAGAVDLHIEQTRTPAGLVHAMLRVTDTGIGIHESKRSEMFERYARVHDHSHRIDGSGLGLAIVREIVLTMGGTIVVDSRVDLGSSFTIELDLATAMAPDACAQPVAPAGFDVPADGRILVVDDDAVVRHVLVEQLQSIGYDTAQAESAEDGLALLGRERFDAVITDLHLGGMDGAEFAAEVKARLRDLRPALLAFSGDDTPRAARACADAGFDARLLKPVMLAELRTTLARLFEARARRSGAAPG